MMDHGKEGRQREGTARREQVRDGDQNERTRTTGTEGGHKGWAVKAGSRRAEQADMQIKSACKLGWRAD